MLFMANLLFSFIMFLKCCDILPKGSLRGCDVPVCELKLGLVRYSFNKYVFEHLLCARAILGAQYSSGSDRNSCSLGAPIQVGEADNNHICKIY